MNSYFTITLAAVLSATLSTAHAEGGRTRAEVRAETLAAANAGQLPHGDLDLVSHPALSQPSHLTRAEVKAELEDAIAHGDVMAGDTGHTLREIDPGRYPAPEKAPQLTRASVKRELVEAERRGELQTGDEGETEAERFPQRYAAKDTSQKLAKASPNLTPSSAR